MSKFDITGIAEVFFTNPLRNKRFKITKTIDILKLADKEEYKTRAAHIN